jgi:hypothetical protein
VRQAIQEGLGLLEQIAALPFKAARQAFRESDLSRRPLGEVVQDSLHLGEDLAKLPFKAVSAVMTEMAQKGPGLEQRVAELEKRLGIQPPLESPPPEPPPST